MTIETLISTLHTAGIARVYPVVAPKGAVFPFVVYHVVASEDAQHSGGQSGLRSLRYQFDAYSANSYSEARNMSKTIRDAVNGQSTIVEDEFDMEPEVDALGRSFRTLLQVTFWGNE